MARGFGVRRTDLVREPSGPGGSTPRPLGGGRGGLRGPGAPVGGCGGQRVGGRAARTRCLGLPAGMGAVQRGHRRFL
ncbi:MAG: hypothetical protein C4303_07780, partial [candidate division GAL15 bacterium]